MAAKAADPGFATGFLCPTGECPSGQACVQGRCQIGDPPTDASTEPAPDAGSPTVQCGAPTQLVDGFDVMPWYTFREANAMGEGGTIEALNGQLTITAPGVDGALVGATDRFHLKAKGERIFVEVLSPSGGALPSFTIYDYGGGADFFRDGDGNLISEHYDRILGVLRRVVTPFSEVDHRWWGFRETEDVLYWEVSADGVSWEILMSAEVTEDMSWLLTAHTRMSARVDNGRGAGFVVFDNLGGGPSASEPEGCPIRLANADFREDAIGSIFEHFGNDCVGSSIDGEWVFNPADGLDTGYCVISGSYRHDLRGSNVSFKLSQAPPASEDLLLGFEIEAKDGFHAFTVVRGMVSASHCLGEDCMELAAEPLDSSYGYLRIREQNEVVFWEKSVDGSNWVEVATTSESFDVRLAVFSVFVSVDGAATTATIAIDDLNLP